MNNFLQFDLLALMISVILTAAIMPVVIRYAFKHNKLDCPGRRKLHSISIPRLGGLAFIPISIIVTIVIWGLVSTLYPDHLSIIMDGQADRLIYYGIAILILYILGAVDDIIGLRYLIKFAGQIICSIIVIMAGLHIENLGGIFGIYEISQPIADILTIVLIVGIINAFNFIDGLDGLCSMLAAIALAVYGGLFFLSGNLILAMLSFSLIGSLSAFFCYNVCGNASRHTKIFMGDTGSTILGLIISISILSFMSFPGNIVTTEGNRIIYLFSPIMIPVMDSVRVFIWRIWHRRNPFVADKNHIHHRILAVGINQITALAIISAMAVFICIFNTILVNHLNINIILLIDIAVWIVFSLVIGLRAVKPANQ